MPTGFEFISIGSANVGDGGCKVPWSSLFIGLRNIALTGMLAGGAFVAHPALAQSAESEASRFRDSGDFVHVVGLARIGEDKVTVTLRVDHGFHINANPASQPYLIPTTVTFAGVTPLRIGYPPSVRFKPKFSEELLDVYEGTVPITADFPIGTLARTDVLHATVTVQACTDQICFPPADLAVSE